MNIENRKFTELEDQITLVWNIEEGIEKVFLEYPTDNGSVEIDIMWEGKDYYKAEQVYNNTKEYME